MDSCTLSVAESEAEGERGDGLSPSSSSHAKNVPFFPEGSSVCTEICNVLILPFIVLFIAAIQLPVLCFGRRSSAEEDADDEENDRAGYKRDDRDNTSASTSTSPLKLKPLRIDLSGYKVDDTKETRRLRHTLRDAMERARPVVMVNAPSAWTDWFRSVSNGEKVDIWGRMPVVPEKKGGKNTLVISAHYFNGNIMYQTLRNIARGFCCGGGRLLPSVALLILYLILAVIVSVVLEGDSPMREIRIVALFFLVLLFTMTLVSVLTRGGDVWRRVRRLCLCRKKRGSSCFCGPTAKTLLGPIHRFIDRVVERDVMYVARFQGYYKAGFAHIDSFASYNFYLVVRGQKRVQLGTRTECARLTCLTRGVDSCFVPHSENDNEAWAAKHFKRMYDFELGPGDILLFHNSAVVHKFRNLSPRGEKEEGNSKEQRRRPPAFADVYSIRLCWDKDIHPMTLRNDIFTPWRPIWSIKKALHMGRMSLMRNIVRITEDI